MKGPWRDAPVEYTDLGYTLKSLDRLWAIVTVDDADPADEYFGNWLWLTGRRIAGVPVSCYELWDDVIVYDRVAEAKADLPNERWHVLNVGDDTRYERAYLEGKPWTAKASSRPALQMKLDAIRRRDDDWYNQRCIQILEAVL